MFSIENIIAGNAIVISLTGMAIVFSGLALISIFINFLPAILNLIGPYLGDEKACADHLEANQRSFSQKESEEHDDDSFWESVSDLAQNIINVIKDTLDLIKGKEKKSS